jgi:hypothetical protein
MGFVWLGFEKERAEEKRSLVYFISLLFYFQEVMDLKRTKNCK